MDKSKYIQWYNLTQETIKNDQLIPKRTNKEIESLVSKNDWLMIPAGTDTKKQGTYSPFPNIFFDINSREGENKDYARIGISFNNLPAVERLYNILTKYCKTSHEELTKQLASLEDVWETRVERKIKRNHPKSTPEYQLVYPAQTNKFDGKIIENIVSKSKEVREEGKITAEKYKLKGEFYRETPNVNLAVCEFQLTEENFVHNLNQIVPIWKTCLEVAGKYSEIKDLERAENKRIGKLDEIIQEWKDYVLELKQRMREGNALPDELTEAEQAIKRLEKRKKDEEGEKIK